jgi:nucleoside-diphosphate-sugar epimerase
MAVKRVLVTGAGGFIGRHTLPLLQARGFEVHRVRRDVTDLLDETTQKRLIESVRPTHLLHLAWDVTPGKYWTSLSNIAWVQASLSLFRIFAQHGGQRWIGAGTCAEYAWTGAMAESLYGIGKLSLGQLQQSLARELAVSFAWGRIFYLYGPHEPRGRLVPSLVRSILQGETALCRHDHLLRDMLHVSDVARAFVEGLDSDLTGPFDIGSGEPVRLGMVAELIAGLCGRPELLQLGNGQFPSNDSPEIVANISRLQSIGFIPKFTLIDGLRDTVEWWRAPDHAGLD